MNKNEAINLKKQLIILFTLLFVITNVVTASTYYPLQTKYPDTMLYKAETNEKVIALTFDDGPDEHYTPKILKLLSRHRIKATFFLLGARVEKYPSVVQDIHDAGHAIGNHTYWHPELTKTGVANMVWEINKNEKAIENAIGIKTDLFRAPYGALNEDLVKKLAELDYRGIGWSIDSEDWRDLTKEEVRMNIINHLHPGAIILMHSIGNIAGGVEALEEIIPYLKEQGYQFVTVYDMWQLHYK